MADDRDSYVYSWSWHHLPPRRMQLRRLKRDMAAVQLGYLFELSRRWIQSFDSTIGSNTILKRFLPYAARGMGTEGAGSEAAQLWDEFTWALTVICGRYESESPATSSLDPEVTDRFTAAALDFIEPYFEEQEAWEDEHLEAQLPEILKRHEWRGKVGEAPGYTAPAAASAGPWWGAFRYTVDAGGERASVHIHNHVAPDSPFRDEARLFGCAPTSPLHPTHHSAQNSAQNYYLTAAMADTGRVRGDG